MIIGRMKLRMGGEGVKCRDEISNRVIELWKGWNEVRRGIGIRRFDPFSGCTSSQSNPRYSS